MTFTFSPDYRHSANGGYYSIKASTECFIPLGGMDTADRAEDQTPPTELHVKHSIMFFRTQLILYSTSCSFTDNNAMSSYQYEATQHGWIKKQRVKNECLINRSEPLYRMLERHQFIEHASQGPHVTASNINSTWMYNQPQRCRETTQ